MIRPFNYVHGDNLAAYCEDKNVDMFYPDDSREGRCSSVNDIGILM